LATILLNGVLTDASTLTGTELADKLTVSGGVDGLQVQLSGGNDLLEIDAESEDITSSVFRAGEGDDVVTVVAGDDDDNYIAPVEIGESLIGGPGEDTITMGDGLASLTGTIKGNEDDDTISVANINGGTIQGNSGDDTISIGFTAGYGEAAGSRAAVAVSDGTVNGSGGDDTITISGDATITDSTIRGNEDDDTITVAVGAVAEGDVEVQGNAGDDTIDATGLEGAVTVRGGQGADTLRVGNGQTVVGGLGADTFSIESAGGATIEDYDRLLLTGEGANDDCFCDDQIQIDGHKIFHTNYTYKVAREDYTSASSWTGDIKVKGVAFAADDAGTTTVTLAETKTETISAFAVAHQFITATEETASPSITYPNRGINKDGDTFLNGLRGFDGTTVSDNNGTRKTASDAVIGSGIGQAYAKATGTWTNNKLSSNGDIRTVTGSIQQLVVQTFNNFEKGDFSFLDLTATEKIGVSAGQTLKFNQITQATIKNHWASYNKSKNSEAQSLYEMNFGTANFNTITTGKAYQIVTNLEDKTYATITLTNVSAQATAKVTLDLTNTFQAWKGNLGNSGTTTSNDFSQITGFNVGTAVGGSVTTTEGSNTFTKSSVARLLTSDGGFAYFNNILAITSETTGLFTDGAATSWTTKGSFFLIGNNGGTAQTYGLTASTAGSSSFLVTDTTDDGKKTYVRYSITDSTSEGIKAISTGTLLTDNQLYWSTVKARGLFTLTTTAVNPKTGFTLTPTSNGSTLTSTTPVNASPISSYTRKFGANNTNRSISDFVTGSGKLVMKIAVSETATAKTDAALDRVVERLTLTGQEFTLATCPAFPSVTANGGVSTTLSELDSITGDFNQKFVWADRTNNLNSGVGYVTATTFEMGPLSTQYAVWRPSGLMGGALRSPLVGEFGEFGIQYDSFAPSTPGTYSFTENINRYSFIQGPWVGILGTTTTTTYCTTASNCFTKTFVVGRDTSNNPAQNALSLQIGTTTEEAVGYMNRSGNAVMGTVGELLNGSTLSGSAFSVGQGFFSASTFTTDALAAEDFGSGAVSLLASINGESTSEVDAEGVPFRVLFFDNEETDNGLYIVSGVADYNNGELTAINTNPTASSAMGGKHTIVKVDGGKGNPIELSDINFV
jgi:hypothetical protein